MELSTKQINNIKRYYLLSTFFLSFVQIGLTQNIDSIKLAQKVDSMIKVHARDIYQGLFQEAAIVRFDSMARVVDASLGKCNWPYIKCNYWKSVPLVHLGRYREAEIVLTEMKSLQETCVGTKWIYGQVLGQLSFIYEQSNRYKLAEQTLLECQEFSKPLTRPFFDIASENTDFGRLYCNMGHYDIAKIYLLRADSIFIANNDSSGYRYTDNLCTLGNLFRHTSDYLKARQYIEKAKRIAELSQYPSERHFLVIIHSLSVLYHELGEYREEERMAMESLDRIEEFYGPNTYPYALGILSYAKFLEGMGRLVESRNALIRAKSIMEALAYENHSDYAALLLNLNSIYIQTDPEKESLDTYWQAKDIMLSLFGSQSDQYATSLLYICNYYLRKQSYDLAEPLLIEAKEVYTQVYGELSIAHYSIYYLLAKCKLATGNYADALHHVKTAESIILKVFNSEHPYYTDLLSLESEIQYFLDNPDELLRVTQSYCANDQAVLTSSVAFLTEPELSYFINLFEERLNLTYSIVSLDSNKIKELPALAYDQALFYKGYILNSVLEWRRALNTNSSVSEEMRSMQYQLRELYTHYVNAVVERDSVASEILDKEIMRINKELMTKIPETVAPLVVTYQDVADKLSNNEVAVEFIDFEINTTKVETTRMLGALVLTSTSVYPSFIPLCYEPQIEKMVSKLENSRADKIANLYGSLTSKDSSVYSLIWKPLEKFCKGKKVVFITKSGILHRINLGAIPVDDGIVLDDEYEIVNLSSTRNITNPDVEDSYQKTGVIIGDIAYDVYEQDSIQARESDKVMQRGYENLPRNPGSAPIKNDWTYLPGSRNEVDNIYTIMRNSNLDLNVLRDTNATEWKVKMLGNNQDINTSPRVIHFSTHGYFFPDPHEYPEFNKVSKSDPVFKTAEHPMIRSGLILAGGNYAWKHGHPYKPDMEDGILTAYEISQLDLSNTELVVLSACETGLGDIKGNEGVYGLQRAFKIAGVKNLIMSLWKVPDAATAELMISFYKHWLEDEMTIRQALYTAQKELRDQGFEPFYWAGWVLVE